MDDRLDSNYDKVTIAIGITGLLVLSILGVGIYFLMDDPVEIDTDWDDDGVLMQRMLVLKARLVGLLLSKLTMMEMVAMMTLKIQMMTTMVCTTISIIVRKESWYGLFLQ